MSAFQWLWFLVLAEGIIICLLLGVVCKPRYLTKKEVEEYERRERDAS